LCCTHVSLSTACLGPPPALSLHAPSISEATKEALEGRLPSAAAAPSPSQLPVAASPHTSPFLRHTTATATATAGTTCQLATAGSRLVDAECQDGWAPPAATRTQTLGLEGAEACRDMGSAVQQDGEEDWREAWGLDECVAEEEARNSAALAAGGALLLERPRTGEGPTGAARRRLSSVLWRPQCAAL
jgi:hypothetical protein